jgi:hypothetical protein
LSAGKKLRIGGRQGREGWRRYLGREGYGRPGGSRLGGLVVVGVELVRLGVEPPDEEESGDGGGEEDEDDPQRAHLFSKEAINE